jgi:hypothetical protein
MYRCEQLYPFQQIVKTNILTSFLLKGMQQTSGVLLLLKITKNPPTLAHSTIALIALNEHGRIKVVSSAVLPGLDVASPPTQQKSTTIWQKFAAIANFSRIPLLFRYFWSCCIDLQLK